MTDSELLDALRRGTDGAVREFLTRFAPLLRGYSARMRLPREESDIIVSEVLEDSVMRFAKLSRARRPQSVAAYLVVCLRNRVLDLARNEAATGERLKSLDAEELGGCSEGTRRAARSADEGREPRTTMSPALLSLARALEKSLTADERRMLVWISESVPQKDIARWMDLSPAALRKRVERLRAKMRVLAANHEKVSTPAEQAELRRFFARCESAREAQMVRDTQSLNGDERLTDTPSTTDARSVSSSGSILGNEAGPSSNGRPVRYDAWPLEVRNDERAQ